MDDEKHGCCADGHWYMGHITMWISKAKYSKLSETLTQPLCELNKVEEPVFGSALSIYPTRCSPLQIQI